MPEYLSPGVFIEEIPARLKAIEGVSTSTAAFVGPAERGPVAGRATPFNFGGTDPFTIKPDPAPLLVTSFSELVRQFGPPLPLPGLSGPDTGYLGHAARAFFDNGGKRLYVSRIVGATADEGEVRARQGTVLRLLRKGKQGDNFVFLTSLRGIRRSPAQTLDFRRRSDGGPALNSSSTPAVAIGTAVAPFALADGDEFSIDPGTGPVGSLPVIAIQATLTSAASGTFNVSGDSLLVRVGGPAEPIQTVTFSGVDPLPVATVVAQINAAITGVQAVAAGGAVELRADVEGSDSSLEVLAGSTAGADLGGDFATLPAIDTGGGSNVADVDHVTIAEVAALFASAAFTIGNDGLGHLRIATTALGAGATLVFANVSGTPLTPLGLNPPASNVAGVGSAAVVLSVSSYETTTGKVTLSGALPNDLDPNEVYALPGGVTPPVTGPIFYARSPGKWSGRVQVQILNSERAPVPVTAPTGPFPDSTIEVQSTSSFYVGAIVEVDHAGQRRTYHEVTQIVGKSLTLFPALVAADPPADPPNSYVRTVEIDLVISDESGAAPTEVYRGLSWNSGGTKPDLRRHYATVINGRSRLVFVQPPGTGSPVLAGSEGADLTSQPVTGNGFELALSEGIDGFPVIGASDGDYIGTDGGPGLRTGIESLKDVTDVRIIAAPGQTSQAVQLALITQCELLRYRFAVLDGERDPAGGALSSILAHRNLYDTSFAGYYAPWVSITLGDETRFLPPSGHVAGIYARVDNRRGVQKAPANESVFTVTGLKTNFTTGEQDILNPRGVNLIRRFDEGGIRVWGARTLSGDPEFRYLNVRRVLIFLEASIDRGTQWVVFEPNTPETWSRVVDSLTAFLDTQWRNGVLFGRKREDAFFVRCDETTMTADDVANGRLIVQIGVAIVKPAEFVIFRIEQLTGFARQ